MAARRSAALIRHLASVAASEGHVTSSSAAFRKIHLGAASFKSTLYCAELQGGQQSGHGGGHNTWGARSFSFSSSPVTSERLDEDQPIFDASAGAAASSGEGGALDLDAITDAVSAAEVDALAAAAEAGWPPTKVLIDSLGWVHDASAFGW